MHRNTITRLAILEGLLMDHLIETLDDNALTEAERIADAGALMELKKSMMALRQDWMIATGLLPAPEGFPEGYEAHPADCCEHRIPRSEFCVDCHEGLTSRFSAVPASPIGGPLRLPCGCFGRCTVIHAPIDERTVMPPTYER